MEINRKLLETLLDLQGKSRSGILRIQRDQAKKQLVVQNGLLVFAESNLPQEHLARIMVAMNLLPRSKLSEIASFMKAGKTSEEAVLALSGGPGMQDLERGRREQAVLIMSSLLGWDGCDVRFYAGDGLVRHRVNLRLALPELIAVSVRQAVSNRLLPIPPKFTEGSYSLAEDFGGKARAFPLNEVELSACSLLKTPMNAVDVFRLIPGGETGPEQTLFCLYVLGLIVQLGQTAQDDGNSTSPASESFARRLEEMMLRFESASLYEMLAVPAEASQDEIQDAYHEYARQLHPDRFQSEEFPAEVQSRAEQVFARINQAYLTLRNPSSRAQYDEERRRSQANVSRAKSGAAQSEETAEELFREGRALLARGDFGTAVERLRGCVWLCPGKAAYHHYLGLAQSEVPKFRKSAEEHLLKAIELEDVSADSHLALAKLYMKVRLYRKAEAQLKQALLWDPENSEARKLSAELKKLK